MVFHERRQKSLPKNDHSDLFDQINLSLRSISADGLQFVVIFCELNFGFHRMGEFIVLSVSKRKTRLKNSICPVFQKPSTPTSSSRGGTTVSGPCEGVGSTASTQSTPLPLWGSAKKCSETTSFWTAFMTRSKPRRRVESKGFLATQTVGDAPNTSLSWPESGSWTPKEAPQNTQAIKWCVWQLSLSHPIPQS